jgi:hypothetical protein
VAGRVGVDLEPLVGGEVVGGLQEASAEGDGVFVGSGQVVDPEVEVDLLGSARPADGCLRRRQGWWPGPAPRG